MFARAGNQLLVRSAPSVSPVLVLNYKMMFRVFHSHAFHFAFLASFFVHRILKSTPSYAHTY